MTAFLSSFNRRISPASSPCPLNWSIWATENQSRQGQIPMLNITLRSLKEKGGPAGLLLLQPSLSRNRRWFYIIGDWSLAIVEETWSTYSFNLESMLRSEERRVGKECT